MKDNTMKKVIIDYKDAVALTNLFLLRRKILMKIGTPSFVAEAMVALNMAYPFSNKTVMNNFELDLNARTILNVVEMMVNHKNN